MAGEWSSAHNDQGYCNCMMQRRGLTRSACKASNIFIHTPFSQVQNICSRRGKHVYGKVYASIARFDHTECQLTSSFLGRCRNRTTVLNSRIHVTCL
ncbi:hypothetical protein KIL84_009765 [Mauremys mutica]|uniref:Ribonuclease A-domain domain-containing protein n=1 Tax=Mauremys mutica TaxID=74926 RepID=A0A9D4B642_9SAUR|nr:hypothetical protein KIL84_009765 [Mauremys mutica]